ncbi:MAG: SRPBCC family protein [Alphaproteobacteria bacterium]
MANDRFHYTIFIRTTPERLWEALLKPEFTKLYWYEATHDSNWEEGAPWRLLAPGGRVADSGKVLQIERGKRIVLSWQHQLMEEMRAEGLSRATIELEQQGEAVKLTLTHEIGKQGSRFIEAVAQGWPAILSSLKSLLEAGKALEMTRTWPKDAGATQKQSADMPKVG